MMVMKIEITIRYYVRATNVNDINEIQTGCRLDVYDYLVDCPNHLICIWTFICSMTKLKEHSREIC